MKPSPIQPVDFGTKPKIDFRRFNHTYLMMVRDAAIEDPNYAAVIFGTSLTVMELIAELTAEQIVTIAETHLPIPTLSTSANGVKWLSEAIKNDNACAIQNAFSHMINRHAGAS